MKLIYSLVGFYFAYQLSAVKGGKIVCYYDTSASEREGLAKFTAEDMELSLQFCDYMIYKALYSTPEVYGPLPVFRQQGLELTNMHKFKTKFPNIKFLLSTSGDMHFQNTKVFLEFLQTKLITKQIFAESTVQTLHKYQFDGLSLDLPLPTERQKRSNTWYNINNLFSSKPVIDAEKVSRKAQLTGLIELLRATFKDHNFILSLTALPNIEPESYLETKAIEHNLDFIILPAFDFHTPESNFKEADYTAPIYAPIKKGNRLPKANVEQLVKTWITKLQVPAQKLMLGLSSWGRTWQLTGISEHVDLPPVTDAYGPAPGGPETKLPGYLSWPEICQQFPESVNESKVLKSTDLHVVVDPTKKYGNYAYRAADSNGDNGIWISYEDSSTVGVKARYAKYHNLGGVALFDITSDDSRGRCNGTTFPLLRSIVNSSALLILESDSGSSIFIYSLFIYLTFSFITIVYV